MPVSVVASTFPVSPLPDSMPAVDVEFAPTSPPTEGPSFRTIATDIRSLSVRRGRSTELDVFQTGKMSGRVGNADRDFDPLHGSSPFNGGVKPERPIRALARWADVTYPLAGLSYLDGFPQAYTAPHDAHVDFSAGDAFKALEGTRLPDSIYELVVSNDRPTHRWKLDDKSGQYVAKDSGRTGANQADGVAYGSRGFGSTAIVPYDGSRTCYSQSADNSYIICPNYATPTGITWSLEFWFQRAASPAVQTGGEPIFIFGQWPAGTGFNWFGMINVAGGQLSFNAPTIGLTGASGANVCDGAPHHVLISVGAATTTIYVDGAVFSTASGTPTATGTQSLILGAFPITGKPWQSFLGSIAEASLWDGVALSATQASDHYNAGKNALTGEYTGTRAGRVLDYAQIPAANRSIQTGNSALGAYDITAGNALDYLQSLAKTERGQFYCSREGTVTWRQRHALLTESRSTTSQATFGDSGSELKYLAEGGIVIDYDEVDVFTDVEVTRTGGTPQRVVDQDAAHEYFTRSHSDTGMLYANDNDAFDHANYLLGRHKAPGVRIQAIIIDPRRDPTNLYPQVLGREIGDRITVKRRPQGVGDAISQELIIEGIDHDISPGRWRTTFRLSQAETRSYWRLDSSHLDSGTRLAA